MGHCNNVLVMLFEILRIYSFYVYIHSCLLKRFMCSLYSTGRYFCRVVANNATLFAEVRFKIFLSSIKISYSLKRTSVLSGHIF